MNAQSLLHMNAAAIDRINLVEQVRNTQSALGERARTRFEKFARLQGGAIYELESAQAIERAFARFEWAEMDSLYTAMFSRLFNGDTASEKSAGTLYREVCFIIRDKRWRFAATRMGATLHGIGRGIGEVARITFLVVLFVAVSSISSEACLYYMR